VSGGSARRRRPAGPVRAHRGQA